MWATALQHEAWFATAMDVLAAKGLRAIVEPDRIVVGKRAGLKAQALRSELEFIEFANHHGARIDPAVIGAPDYRYGPGDIPFVQPPPPPPPQPPAAETMRERVRAERSDVVREELLRLRQLCEQVIAQREEWERRATAAEARAAELTRRLDGVMAHGHTGGDRGNGAVNRRFERLKRLIALEFHPDHADASGAEKQIRAEIFKLLWPRIEAIERAGD